MAERPDQPIVDGPAGGSVGGSAALSVPLPPAGGDGFYGVVRRLAGLAADWLTAHGLRPPVALATLERAAAELAAREGLPAAARPLLMILLHNAAWAPTVAAIPFKRRLLLLPQCLRDSRRCPAERDAFGLLCEGCGRCPIGELQAFAEDLGYVVLVAEGNAIVKRLLTTGKVDGVIGVSCLGALEKAFPHLAADAVPGLAIPLARDGCRDTEVDVGWVRAAVAMVDDGGEADRPLDFEGLRGQVQRWFGRARLRDFGIAGDSPPGGIAADWLAAEGKRWRPFLVAATFRALAGSGGPVPDGVRRLAVAVECFHKASLVHDDIEDGDAVRYGAATLHRRHGVPQAINVGDLLVGEGYRLIAAAALPAERTAAILGAVAEGHRQLCVGQGEELAAMDRELPPEPERLLGIFRLKTAPAFQVALQTGALAAGHADLCPALAAFSVALGVGYQIRDDLDEAAAAGPAPDQAGVAHPRAWRASLLTALAWQRGGAAERSFLEECWRQPSLAPDAHRRYHRLVARSGAAGEAAQLLAHHLDEAVAALGPIRNIQLRMLLRRLIGRLLERT